MEISICNYQPFTSFFLGAACDDDTPCATNERCLSTKCACAVGYVQSDTTCVGKSLLHISKVILLR